MNIGVGDGRRVNKSTQMKFNILGKVIRVTGHIFNNSTADLY
jgi:hypothetical protein